MPRSTTTIDHEVIAATQAEERRQREDIVLIASENYVSGPVREATGSVFTNKYAEGYPGRRYYAGCDHADEVENLARNRLLQLFAAEHANVQSHSGTQANMAAYAAMLKPGDRILGMRLDQGGHLSHGSSVNFSGKLYEIDFYGVDRETEQIDFDALEQVAHKFRPHVIVAGATAYPRTIDFHRFRQIADQSGARLVADIAHISGLIAGGSHPSPLPHADVVTSTTHKTLRGPRGAFILSTQDLAQLVDRAVFPNVQGGPFINVIAAKAVAFGEAMRPDFRTYANAIVKNARALASSLLAGGLRIVSGGTDNHLMLVDLRSVGLTGSDAEATLRLAGIVTNKNAIPFDPLPPRVTSGLRIGTAAVTSRGMNANNMEEIASFILEALRLKDDVHALETLRARVKTFAISFYMPGLDDY